MAGVPPYSHFSMLRKTTTSRFAKTPGGAPSSCDEAAAAGELVAELGNLDDGDGGGGGMAAIGTPDRSTMSRNQWKRFKEIAKRIQGRK